MIYFQLAKTDPGESVSELADIKLIALESLEKEDQHKHGKNWDKF